MKTVARLIRRYILAAFGIILLVLTVNAVLLLGIVVHFGSKHLQEGYCSVKQFSQSFSQRPDGNITPSSDLKWENHFEWAMLLDDNGNILWAEHLPAKLYHSYTVPEVASFSRWYLNDYPVMVYRNEYGLLVAGKPIGSMTRFDFYMDNDILNALLSVFLPLLLLDLGLLLFLCLWLGWHGAKPLRELARGIGLLADGKEIHLKQSGATAELAEQLNQTSRHLQKQNELIQHRDMTRANWISGVSHDIRTPLSLIMGYGEQLAQQFPLHSETRKKADSICTQSKKIKALIEDLNLTFKLQYNAHPLRRTSAQVGAWLRRCAADFCNSLEENFSVELLIVEPAGQTILDADWELLTRAVDNLLNNSVQHNPSGCDITVLAEIANDQILFQIRDNGTGYTEAVLQNLSGACSNDNIPHILGLHLVQQIIAAHGGQADFCNDNGAAAVLSLPIQLSAAGGQSPAESVASGGSQRRADDSSF